MMKNKFYKVASLVLAGALCISSFAVPTFANEATEQTVVVNEEANIAVLSEEDEVLQNAEAVVEETDVVENQKSEEVTAEASSTVESANKTEEVSQKKEDEAEATTTQIQETSAENTLAAATSSNNSKYKNLAVVQLNKGEKLNVRKSKKESSAIVGYMEKDAVCTVLKTSGKWCCIKSGSVKGWVKKSYLLIGDAEAIKAVETSVAIVKVSGTKLYKKASKKSSKKATYKTGKELKVISTSVKGWIKVSANGKKGYVKSGNVKVETSYKTAESVGRTVSAAGITKQNLTTGDNVVEYALKFVGNPYKRGGTSLTHGADCSGFIMSVYKHYGYSLPHSSYELRKVGKKVKWSEMQPGDILCYQGHVAMYIGNGKIVHASTPSTGIKISDVNYKKPITIRRVIY